MKAHIDKTQKHLGELSGLASKTEAAERRILAAAQKRLADVQAEIQQLGPGIEGRPDADQDKYIELVAERGQLTMRAEGNLLWNRSRGEEQIDDLHDAAAHADSASGLRQLAYPWVCWPATTPQLSPATVQRST